MAEGVNRAYELWRESSDKFDYFMAGLSSAVLSFFAADFKATRIGCNAAALELLAIVLLVGSVLASLKRLESTVHLQRVSIGRLEQIEGQQRAEAAVRGEIQIRESGTSEIMNPDALRELLERRKTLVEVARTMEGLVQKRAEQWSSARYYLLLGGLVLVIVARVWTSYQ